MKDNITIQERFFNELQGRIRDRHIIKVFVTPSERWGLSSISMMNAYRFNELLKATADNNDFKN